MKTLWDGNLCTLPQQAAYMNHVALAPGAPKTGIVSYELAIALEFDNSQIHYLCDP